MYVATRGYLNDWGLFFYERGTVNITIYYMVDPNQSWEKVNSILATDNNLVDNSGDLAGLGRRYWRIPSDAVGVKIVVTYVMEGPRDHPEGECFNFYYGLYPFCGSTFERDVRLPFYIELIPSELLGS